jgi:hypothetical protein
LNILKESGNRLRTKATISIVIAVGFLVALFALGLTTAPSLPIAINWAEYTNFYALFLLLLALGAMRYYRKYQNYRQGFLGEGRVTRYLRLNFGEEHFLIDDLVYVNEKGHKENIDHIVLSPNGIFVLETKDYRGKITCRGSFWTVPFPYGRSPSKQARGNAWWVKKNIDDSMVLRDINIWVEPIVVFSNPDVDLEVIDPEAEVVKLDELVASLASYSNGYNFSSEQLKAVGKKILEKSLPF